MTPQQRSPEAQHERGVVAPLYGSLGFDVFATSARVHPVGVTPGIADLIVFARALDFTFFHETKVGTYRQTEAQWLFMRAANASGSPYVLGDVASANQFLCWLGIAVPLSNTVRFYPKPEWAGRFLMKRASGPPDRGVRDWGESDEHYEQGKRWGFQH